MRKLRFLNGLILMSQYKNFETGIKEITPKDAKKFLANTKKNPRKMDMKLVRRYARDMRRGAWELGEQVLVLNNEGKELSVINGQNTLHAIVEAGVTIPMLVLIGPISPRSMGMGKAHGIHTKFINDGDPYGANRVARIRVIWLLLIGKYAPALSPNHAYQISDVFKRGLDRASEAFPGKKHVSSAPIAGALALAYPRAPEKIDALISRLIAKAPTGPKDPAKHLLEQAYQKHNHNGSRQILSAINALTMVYYAAQGLPVPKKPEVSRETLAQFFLEAYDLKKVDEALTV